MIVIAHILGMPVEELLVPLASGGVGVGMLLVLASVISRVRRRRSPHSNRQQDADGAPPFEEPPREAVGRFERFFLGKMLLTQVRSAVSKKNPCGRRAQLAFVT